VAVDYQTDPAEYGRPIVSGDKTIKLLQVLPSVNPEDGGPIEAVRQMGRELQALGHIVEVLSLDGPSESFIGGFPLPVHATGPSLGLYGYNTRLVRWLSEHARQYDAVIVNGLWRYSTYGSWRALRRTKVPYYIYLHGMLDPWFKTTYPFKHLKKWMYWPWADYRVVRDARAVLFTSEEERIRSRQSFRLYRAREYIVPLGVSAPPASGSAQREQFLAVYPALRGRKLLLFLGRIHEKKGCDLLIRAFASIAKKDPTLHLVIAGPDSTGWITALKRLAGALGISDRVTWPGLLRDEMKWGAFYASAAFALPSHQENFGIAVVEAMACGLPVLISNKVNIWREIVAAEAGIVDADTEAGAGSTLAAWHAMSDADKSRMSRNALELFARHFTASAMAERLVSLIQSTAASTPASDAGA
jgi:glycosyltransferase involved in cell wall biosynthesis